MSLGVNRFAGRASLNALAWERPCRLLRRYYRAWAALGGIEVIRVRCPSASMSLCSDIARNSKTNDESQIENGTSGDDFTTAHRWVPQLGVLNWI